MAFIETPRFPDKISYGSSGGPSYSTDVITVTSGHETRNQNWVQSRHVYDAAFGVVSEPRLSELIEYFHAMAGKTHEFRYKDWGDYMSCQLNSTPSLVDQIIGSGDSIDGSGNNDIAGSITGGIVQRTTFIDSTKTEPDGYYDNLSVKFLITSGNINNNLVASIIDYDSLTGTFTIDPENLAGDLTFGDTYEIERTHNRDYQLVKNYTKGLLTSEREINKPIGTGLGDSTVLIAVDGVLKTEATHYLIDYTTGVVTFIPNNLPIVGQIITAGYEFDVPCRFDTDQLNINFEAYSIGSASVPIIEVRI